MCGVGHWSDANFTLPYFFYIAEQATSNFFKEQSYHEVAGEYHFCNMQTLKFKVQLMIGFFAAVNQNYRDIKHDVMWEMANVSLPFILLPFYQILK